MDKSLFVILAILNIFPVSSYSTREPGWKDDPYHHIVNLDSKGDVVLEWVVKWDTRSVIFNVTAKTQGYIGFGITSTGKMSEADLIFGGVNTTTGEGYLWDMHVPAGTRLPVLDRSQDYTLISAWENGTHTSIAFSREFETCDENDHVINDDTIRFIWALGEKDEGSYHYQHRGEYVTYVLSPDYTPRELQQAQRQNHSLQSRELLGNELKVWTVTRRQHVPPAETTYWCSFHKGPVLNKKHHMIGFNFRIENDIQARHTHHLFLLKCTPPPGVNPREFFQPFIQNNTGETCYGLTNGQSIGIPIQYCRDVVYPFAIGMKMYFLPNHIGLPFGDSPDEYYLLQVHYDNPNQRNDLDYAINIDIYYTSELREHDAGIINVGHNAPGSPSLLLPPMSLQHNIQGHCGGECTGEMFPPEGVNVATVQSHTHYSGIQVRVRQIRNGVELPYLADDNNYSNLFQFTKHLRSEVRLLPGDHISVKCVFDNGWANGNSTVGGFATDQEMCMANLFYYNKVPFYSVCRSFIQSEEYNWKHLGVGNVTWTEPLLEFVANEPPELEGWTVSDISNELINWTEGRRRALQRDQLELPQRQICAKDDLAAAGVVRPRRDVRLDLLQEYRQRDEAEQKCYKKRNTRRISAYL